MKLREAVHMARAALYDMRGRYSGGCEAYDRLARLDAKLAAKEERKTHET